MKENRSFLKNIRFFTALDLIKCLTQIKDQITEQRLFLICAPISELPSNIKYQ